MEKLGITELLIAWRGGSEQAREHLVAEIYDDLRRMARHLMAGERASHTLDPTSLVHEAYLRLVDTDNARAENRAHFIALATRLMRQILVDHARARNAAKRGGDLTRVTLGQARGSSCRPVVDVIDLHRALDELEAVDPERSRLVELRWIGGLNVLETAEVLGISERTVKRRWRSTRAWLERHLCLDGELP